ncbi:MAG: hypothetical protein ABIP54_00295, partial [Candidatus Andersenbacteria bacterium]
MGEGITVRTMKDDIADLKNLPLSSSKKNNKNPKKELAPMPQHNPRKKIFIFAGLFVVLLLIGIGAWFAYSNFAGTTSGGTAEQAALPITDVIPNNALAVVVYNGGSVENKAVIASLWGSQANGNVNSLTNPSRVFAQASVSAVYYFTLANNPTPFMVVQKTTDTTAYLATLQGVVQTERGGWYIAHESAVDDYTVAM